MEEQKLSLKERIAAERARRQEELDIKESTFKVDRREIVEDNTISDIVSNINKEEYPVHAWLSNLVERMGFDLKVIAEDGTHFYTQGNFQCFINTKQETYQLIEIYKSGTEFSHSVERLIEEKKQYIVDIFSEVLFLAPDRLILNQIEKDKEAWNRLYSKKLGKWK